MKSRTFALYVPGGHTVRVFAYGKLAEVRYVDVVRTDVQSPDSEEFITLLKAQQLTDEDLTECRIGYVDDKGVGDYTSWQEFLDMAKEAG